jgi:hypothetical protein
MHRWITPGGKFVSARTFPQLVVKYYLGKVTGKSKKKNPDDEQENPDDLMTNSPLWIGSRVYPLNRQKLSS